ncbi:MULTISPECIES: hypothetical protein [unclassified Helicobacter]|nr:MULTISPECIES: hypothetical protein [unclassified Helicobacter]
MASLLAKNNSLYDSIAVFWWLQKGVESRFCGRAPNTRIHQILESTKY